MPKESNNRHRNQVISLLLVGSIGILAAFILGYSLGLIQGRKEERQIIREDSYASYTAELAKQEASAQNFLPTTNQKRNQNRDSIYNSIQTTYPNFNFIGLKDQHNTILVDNLDVAIKWYDNFLLEEPRLISKDKAIYAINQSTITLQLVSKQKLKPETYYQWTDQRAIEDHLLLLNTKIIKPKHRFDERMNAIFVQDPFGNEIRILISKR